LNTHAHFHCCVIDGVFAVGEDGQIHIAEAAALIPLLRLHTRRTQRSGKRSTRVADPPSPNPDRMATFS
jgi:hypothetical protein